MNDILNDPYMKKNYIPSRLPTSCLTTAPRFDQGRLSIMPTDGICSPRRPLGDMNHNVGLPSTDAAKNQPAIQAATEKPAEQIEITPQNICLKNLCKSLARVAKNCRQTDRLLQETEDPASTPIFWISKWVDYTDKYGLGYQLCDNSIGVLFNDYSRIVLMADENNLQYIERSGEEQYHNLKAYPQTMTKKITLLKYFRNYMNEHLLKTGEKSPESDDLTRLPYLKTWFRTRNAIVFVLTNGTVQVWFQVIRTFVFQTNPMFLNFQINFFNDHTKIILCPLMNAVTYVNSHRDFRTFKISLLERHGCSKELVTRLRYANDVLDRLINTKSGVTNQWSGPSQFVLPPEVIDIYTYPVFDLLFNSTQSLTTFFAQWQCPISNFLHKIAFNYFAYAMWSFAYHYYKLTRKDLLQLNHFQTSSNINYCLYLLFDQRINALLKWPSTDPLANHVINATE